MMQYDFLILSPHEFENFSRDVLQKKFSVFIESFTTGRDGGTDFRFTKDKSKKIVIQSKRYSNYVNLLSHLKNEVQKVIKQNPEKYILTTSVGLTPDNKETIKSLFSPYIKNTEDILGKDDLLNLLSIYGEIERKYYKLWLGSTNILDKILHSKIYNQSAFELEEIHEQVKLYVQNNSFDDALKILKEHRYVIISGIPGIGKSTLARVLVLYLLSSDFQEFVYLNQSINDGYELFSEGKKQVFFFDDFLGKNFFEKSNEPNEDNRIVKFIEKIKRTPDKVLILATREYILTQAKLAFEAFKINDIEIAKCILDLSSYTNVIKAQIIYNHLFFAEVPIDHLSDLLKKENHLKLVHHLNYNPRIIEEIIKRKIWLHCRPDEFTRAFITFFNNPESVWLYSFENSLDRFSQFSLLVLLSMGTPVSVEDWEAGVKSFLTINNYKFLISFDAIKFSRTIQELENSFIKTQKDTYSTIAVDYQNPSVQDFLVNYLKLKNDLISSLLESMIFTDQLFTIFTTDTTDNENNKRKISLGPNLSKTAILRVIKEFDRMTRSRLVKARYPNDSSFTWFKVRGHNYPFLNQFLEEFSSLGSDVTEFIYEKFNKSIYIDTGSYDEQYAYANLLKTLDITKLNINEERLVDFFIDNITWLDNAELFWELRDIFPSTFNDAIQGQYFKDKIESLVSEELESVQGSEITELREKIESVGSMFNLSFEEEIEKLVKKGQEYDDYLDHEADSYIDDRRDVGDDYREDNEEKVIQEIFNSLIDR